MSKRNFRSWHFDSGLFTNLCRWANYRRRELLANHIAGSGSRPHTWPVRCQRFQERKNRARAHGSNAHTKFVNLRPLTPVLARHLTIFYFVCSCKACSYVQMNLLLGFLWLSSLKLPWICVKTIVFYGWVVFASSIMSWRLRAHWFLHWPPAVMRFNIYIFHDL